MKKVLLGLVVLGALAAGGAFFWMEKSVGAMGPATAPDVELTVAKGTTARALGH